MNYSSDEIKAIKGIQTTQVMKILGGDERSGL
jgi:hypothetical protein